MIGLRREKVDSSLEKKIVTGMITSTKFLAKVVPLMDKNIFNEYSEIIATWCVDFFSVYQKAPAKQIEIIFEENKLEIDPDLADNISSFLQFMSDKYVESNDQIDSQYFFDKTEKFFRDKVYYNFAKTISNKYKLNNLDSIDQDILQLQKKTPQVLSYKTPLKNIEHFLNDQNDVALSNEGTVGGFLGEMRKGWLVSFQAPEKGGKSFILNEMMFRGLEQNKKVLFISLEMNEQEIQERIYNRLTGHARRVINPVQFPIMDCLLNQTGECKKPCRVNNIHIMIGDTLMDYPLPGNKKNYTPCTACRGTFDFVPTNWFNEINIPDLSVSKTEEKMKHFQKLFPGAELVTKSFPAFSATPEDIKNYLSSLEYGLDFVPDIFILDYVDILDNLNISLSERGRIDFVWKLMKQIAEEKHILVITAEQSRRLFGKEVQDGSDVSEDKRKNSHINAKFSINSTTEETAKGIRRIGHLFHRHQKISTKMLLCLSCLEVSAPMIDTEVITYFPKTKKTNNK